MRIIPSHVLPALIAGVSSLVLVLPVCAQQTETQLHVARQIRLLGSQNYNERHDAGLELARLGPAGRSQLEEALKSENPEVRLRARSLLDRLKVRDLWSGGVVTFRAEGQASEALAAFAEQTGNHVLTGDQYGTFVDAKLNLAMEQKGFWEAIDDVCKFTGNHVRPHYDSQTPGVVVASGAPGKYPVAYSGPIRAQVTSARRVFIEELDYEDMSSTITHTFQINLQMMWEDRFRLMGYCTQPELVRAVTDTGINIAATQPASDSWNVATAGTRQITTNLRLNPPPTDAKSFSDFTVKWGLVAVGDMATLAVDQIEAKQQFHQDDVALTIESVEKLSGSRYDICLIVARDIAMPEPQDILFQENSVELLDQEGKPFRVQSQNASLVDRGAELKLSFAGDSSESAPKTLKLVYPRLRAKKDLEITFRHVPIPAQRPE